jgi:hypothetical protein
MISRLGRPSLTGHPQMVKIVHREITGKAVQAIVVDKASLSRLAN